MANKNPNTSGIGKGKRGSEYRSAITREAYEQNASKCLRIITNIIDKAYEGDPLCLKLFAQTYMTKAPQEMQMTIQSDATPDTEKTKQLIAYFVGKGMTEREAALRLIEMEEVSKMLIN